MKLLSIISACMLLIAISIFPVYAAPRLSIIEGDLIDFGQVGPDIYKMKLHIINQGDGVLIISDIGKSCGCTLAPIDKKEISVNDTAVMEVSFNVQRSNGEKNSLISIKSNDSLFPVHNIRLQCFVIRDIVVEPNSFPSLLKLDPSQSYTTSVKLKNTGDKPITLFPPKLEKQYLKMDYSIKEAVILKPKADYELSVTFKPINSGDFFDNVIVPTDSPIAKDLQIRLIFHAN